MKLKKATLTFGFAQEDQDTSCLKQQEKDTTKVHEKAKAKMALVTEQLFQLYSNLITEKAWQPWAKIATEQIDTPPPMDQIKGAEHT